MNCGKDIDIIYNDRNKVVKDGICYTNFLSRENAQSVRRFFETFPKYELTPLVELKNLAGYFKVKDIYVKDESKRFGLNAFKALGGCYAISKCICSKLGIDIKDASFEVLSSRKVKDKLGDLVFVTATDGNHGRGVAWAARQFGFRSIVYMPKGSALDRLNNIKKEGAEASVTDMNYDDAVRYAKKVADNIGGIMVQDTAWEGYEEIPTWIMQGYTAIMDEAYTQIEKSGYDKPTHVFLQAGVGSFAGAMLGYLVNTYSNDSPISVIVEPSTAACIYKSASLGDGKIHPVTGDMETIMAGLACGEPNTISWKILRDYSSAYASCDDYVSARGMRILANPLDGDEKIVSGESGAAGMGLLSLILQKDEFKDAREKLKLDGDSRILVISTEGDTYPENYRSIVWDGKCSSYR